MNEIPARPERALAGAIGPHGIAECGPTGKSIETLIDHTEFDEGRDPMVARA